MNFHTLLALSMLPGYCVAYFYAPLPYVGFAYALMCTFSIVYHANANKNDENTTIKSRRLDYIFQEVLIMSHLFLLNEPPIVKYIVFSAFLLCNCTDIQKYGYVIETIHILTSLYVIRNFPTVIFIGFFAVSCFALSYVKELELLHVVFHLFLHFGHAIFYNQVVKSLKT